MNMSEEQKRIFREQLRISTDKVLQLQHDTTPEGTKEFYKHAGILDEITQRCEIAVRSQKNVESLGNTLSNLFG